MTTTSIETIADTIRSEMARLADEMDVTDRWDAAVVSLFQTVEVAVEDGQAVLRLTDETTRCVAHWVSVPVDMACEVLGIAGLITTLDGDAGCTFRPFD